MLDIKIKTIDFERAFSLLARNEEIDVDEYTWNRNVILIPETEDGKETWNTIMILFEHENIQIE